MNVRMPKVGVAVVCFLLSSRLYCAHAFLVCTSPKVCNGVRNDDVRTCALAHHPSSSTSTSFQAATSKRNKAPIDRQGGIIYRTSVFEPQELAVITKEAETYLNNLQPETSSSVAHKRTGLTLPAASSPTVQLLQSPTNRLTQLVRSVCNDATYILAPDVPVQLRCYGQPGAGMAWHVDDVLYTRPDASSTRDCDVTHSEDDDEEYAQVEVVWTLLNTSDCNTRWKVDGTQQQSCETDPNSVLLLRAGGVEHCVTSLRRGQRVILKCAYIRPGAKYVGDDDPTWNVAQQFRTKRSSRKELTSYRSKRKLRRR